MCLHKGMFTSVWMCRYRAHAAVCIGLPLCVQSIYTQRHVYLQYTHNFMGTYSINMRMIYSPMRDASP